MSHELLPCPFCGGKPELRTAYRSIGAGDMGVGSSAGYVTDEYVLCPGCGARHHPPSQWAKKHWNSRTSEQRVADMTRALEITLNWLDEALDSYGDAMMGEPDPNKDHPAFWANAARRWLEQQRSALASSDSK